MYIIFYIYYYIQTIELLIAIPLIIVSSFIYLVETWHADIHSEGSFINVLMYPVTCGHLITAKQQGSDLPYESCVKNTNLKLCMILGYDSQMSL